MRTLVAMTFLSTCIVLGGCSQKPTIPEDFETPEISAAKRLSKAIRDKDLNTIRKTILEVKDLNASEDGQLPPLHLAASVGFVAGGELLVDSGSEIDFTCIVREQIRADKISERPSSTPLHLAALGGHTAFVQWLLVNGADVNILNDVNGKRSTPLDFVNAQVKSLEQQLESRNPRANTAEQLTKATEVQNLLELHNAKTAGELAQEELAKEIAPKDLKEGLPLKGSKGPKLPTTNPELPPLE